MAQRRDEPHGRGAGLALLREQVSAADGRTDPSQLFPDSSQGFIGGDLVQFVLVPRATRAPRRSPLVRELGLAARNAAGAWLFLRWLGDLKGQSISAALDQTSLTGVANVEAQAGETVQRSSVISRWPCSRTACRASRARPSRRATVSSRATCGRSTRSASIPHRSAAQSAAYAVPRGGDDAAGGREELRRAMLIGTMDYWKLTMPSSGTEMRLHFAELGRRDLPVELRRASERAALSARRRRAGERVSERPNDGARRRESRAPSIRGARVWRWAWRGALVLLAALIVFAARDANGAVSRARGLGRGGRSSRGAGRSRDSWRIRRPTPGRARNSRSCSPRAASRRIRCISMRARASRRTARSTMTRSCWWSRPRTATRCAFHTWWFPIVGSVPYKGYFRAADALAEAAELTRAGFDTDRAAGVGVQHARLLQRSAALDHARRGQRVAREHGDPRAAAQHVLCAAGIGVQRKLRELRGSRGAERFFAARGDSAHAAHRARWTGSARSSSGGSGAACTTRSTRRSRRIPGTGRRGSRRVTRCSRARAIWFEREVRPDVPGLPFRARR